MWIVDGHCDTLWAAPRQGRDWTASGGGGHVDLPRLVQAGVGIQFMALFSDPQHQEEGYALKALEMIGRFYAGLEAASRRAVAPSLGVVRTREDVDRAKEGFWGLLAIEGGEAIGTSLDALYAFYRLGVRSLGLVWNRPNPLGDGVGAGESAGGLTAFGKKVVKALHELGMLVDVSHLSERGFWDVINVARGPVIASHSNAKALCGHPRNLTDDQIRAIAETGGVVGVNLYPPFLSTAGQATIDDVVRHIEHIAAVGGIECVGLGTDFDGIDTCPAGLEDVTKLPALAAALKGRGFDGLFIDRVMGGNWARVLRAVLPSEA